MKIYDETKSAELKADEIDLEKGYLKTDTKVIHREAVAAQKAVYNLREEKLPNGSTQVWKELVMPAIEAQEARDETIEIKVYVPYTNEELKERQIFKLRHQRKNECFPIINRGQLWYNKLTEIEKVELKEWYEAWLNVTETFIIPDKPNWIK